MDVKEVLNQLVSNELVIKALNFIKDDNEFALDEQIDFAMIESPTGHEYKKAELINRKFKSLGLLNSNIDEINNTYAYLNKINDCILIEAHLDTVFPLGTVTNRPVIDEDGYINCPGITDDNRGLEVIMSIIRALKYSNLDTKYNVMFAATAKEEGIGSISGMKKIVNENNNIKAGISIDGDHYKGIIYKAIGLLTKKYTFKGLSGHSYVDFGKIGQVNNVCANAISKISKMKISKSNPRSSYAITNIHGGSFEGLHMINNEVYFIVNYRSESKDELARMDKEIENYVIEAIREEEDSIGVSNQITYSCETLCDIPAGDQSKDSLIVNAYAKVIEYLGDEVKYEDGICCNANALISIGKPAVCMGAGSTHNAYIHSLKERFYTVDAYKQSQAAFLLLLMLAGTNFSNSIFD